MQSDYQWVGTVIKTLSVVVHVHVHVLCTGRNGDHNSLGSNRASSLDGGIRQQQWGECEGEEGEGSSCGEELTHHCEGQCTSGVLPSCGKPSPNAQDVFGQYQASSAVLG